MKIFRFSIIKLALCLIIGIIISKYLDLGIFISLIASVVLTSITVLLYFLCKKNTSLVTVFGISTLLSFIAIGIFVTNVNEDLRKHSHFSSVLSETTSEQNITFRIRELLKPNAFSQRYYVDILQIENTVVTGKALLNIKKDSLNTILPIDAVYFSKAKLNALQIPLNPDQFSYKNYLSKQQVYFQLYETHKTLLQLDHQTRTIFGFAAKFRNLINSKLKPYNYTEDQLSIINALLLGQRQHITKLVYDNYTNAGAIHILAVSGLHVGIILLILNFIFKPLERLKKGLLIKTSIILILLWIYALIAGGSASIIRATTMFSIVAIGMNLKLPTNIYNTLAISVFILLLVKPNFLFDVGFQLSYAAVIAIVSFQPILERLWSPKYLLSKKLWQTLTVTVAAQFGIIPISLYYFHQFPSLFWLSNLVVIPFLGIILGYGILIIVLSLFGMPKTIVSDSFGLVIDWMNHFFGWISNQENFLITDIPFTITQVIVSYLIILCAYKMFQLKNHRWVALTLLSVIMLQVTYSYNFYSTKGDTLIVFHKGRNTLLGQKHNNTLAVFSNLKSAENNSIIKSYAVKNNIKTIPSQPLQAIYKLKNKHLLIVDSLGVYNLKELKVDFVLLTQSPKVNLDRLIDSLKPKVIIADGNNYKSYVKQWSNTCKKQKLPFYHTGKTGAYIIK